jgi:hypothetical protein
VCGFNSGTALSSPKATSRLPSPAPIYSSSSKTDPRQHRQNDSPLGALSSLALCTSKRCLQNTLSTVGDPLQWKRRSSRSACAARGRTASWKTWWPPPSPRPRRWHPLLGVQAPTTSTNMTVPWAPRSAVADPTRRSPARCAHRSMASSLQLLVPGGPCCHQAHHQSRQRHPRLGARTPRSTIAALMRRSSARSARRPMTYSASTPVSPQALHVRLH